MCTYVSCIRCIGTLTLISKVASAGSLCMCIGYLAIHIILSSVYCLLVIHCMYFVVDCINYIFIACVHTDKQCVIGNKLCVLFEIIHVHMEII